MVSKAKGIKLGSKKAVIAGRDWKVVIENAPVKFPTMVVYMPTEKDCKIWIANFYDLVDDGDDPRLVSILKCAQAGQPSEFGPGADYLIDLLEGKVQLDKAEGFSLKDLLEQNPIGAVLECVKDNDCSHWSQGTQYKIVESPDAGKPCIIDGNGKPRFGIGDGVKFVAVGFLGQPEDDVDTWGIGRNYNAPPKKEWEPDTIGEHIDTSKRISDWF